MLQTGQFPLFRVLGSPLRPLWPLRLLAILRWLRPPFLSIAADRDDHSSAVAADQGRLFLDADYVSVEATPVAPERFSIIDRASLGEIVVSLTTHVSRTLPPRFAQTLPCFSCWSPDLSGRVRLQRVRAHHSWSSELRCRDGPFWASRGGERLTPVGSLSLFSALFLLTPVGSSPQVSLPLATSTPALGLAAFRGVMLAHVPTRL